MASQRIRAMKLTLPALFGEVWLRLPVNVQRMFVTLRCNPRALLSPGAVNIRNYRAQINLLRGK